MTYIVSGYQWSSCSECESKFDNSQITNKLNNNNMTCIKNKQNFGFKNSAHWK